MKKTDTSLSRAGIFFFFLFSFLHGTSASELQVTFNVSHFANGNNISCHGAADGSIEAVIVGGVSPYTFSWSNGAYLNNIQSRGYVSHPI